MMRLLILLLLLPAALAANEIGVSAPDGKSGWLLLEDPPGRGGEGLSPFAGDPGLPVPDATGWPWNGKPDGRYPTTELWHYDSRTGEYTRATHVLSDNRTLNAVFEAGAPYVLHYDPRKALGGYSQVLKADGLANAGGKVPAAAIALNSVEYLDSPSVSPDRKHVVFRAYKPGEGGSWVLRVYAIADWNLVAESKQFEPGRPVWANNSTLAVIAWDKAVPRPPQHTPGPGTPRLSESHPNPPGRLLTLQLQFGEFAEAELLKGNFPADRLTQSVLADPYGLGLAVARADGKGVVVEQRELSPGGKVREIARFETFRGMAVSMRTLQCNGVRTLDRKPVLVTVFHDRWGEIDILGHKHYLPVGDKWRNEEGNAWRLSPDPHGGLIDLGRGVAALLEPVVNPDYDPKTSTATALLRHVLVVPQWPGCDSMRNPRQLARLSKLVRRFDEVDRATGGIPSTQLIYDVVIEANEGQNRKAGRYVEIYHKDGRGGRGAIRTEDNLSGSWLVQSIERQGGEDFFYDCSNIAGAMRKRRAADVGKVYDDLVTQLQTRRLLMLTGVEQAFDRGGLQFLGRDVYNDPLTGKRWRAWVFTRQGGYLDQAKADELQARIEKLKAELAKGEQVQDALASTQAELAFLPRERLELRFIAGLPIDGAGTWDFPHALARAGVRFAMAGNRPAAVTDLVFEPGSFVELPNLLDLKLKQKGKPPLLLPRTFRIFEFVEGKAVERLKATAVEPPAGKDGVPHDKALVRDGMIRAGYDLPAFNTQKLFTDLQR